MSLDSHTHHSDELLHVLDVGLVDAAVPGCIWVLFFQMPLQTLLVAIDAVALVDRAEPSVLVLGCGEQSVVAQVSMYEAEIRAGRCGAVRLPPGTTMRRADEYGNGPT